MTKAHALKNYFKEAYDYDIEGMSTVEVLRAFLKEKYDFDATGNSVVSLVQEMIANELFDGGETGDYSNATVTITNNSSKVVEFNCPHTNSSGDIEYADSEKDQLMASGEVIEERQYNVILYKGTAYFGTQIPTDVSVITTGDIEELGQGLGIYAIHGDATIVYQNQGI
jgi:hypothetical protein